MKTSDARKRLAEQTTGYEWPALAPRLEGYFVAPDAFEDMYLWRECGEYPVPVIAEADVRHDPAVWALLVAATGGAA